MRRVMNGYRLKLNAFPPGLHLLVSSCWSDNEDARPTFSSLHDVWPSCVRDVRTTKRKAWFVANYRNSRHDEGGHEASDEKSLCTDFGHVREDQDALHLANGVSSVVGRVRTNAAENGNTKIIMLDKVPSLTRRHRNASNVSPGSRLSPKIKRAARRSSLRAGSATRHHRRQSPGRRCFHAALRSCDIPSSPGVDPHLGPLLSL